MNYTLIMLDNPILVSDEEIKEGDNLYHPYQPYFFKATIANKKVWIDCKKIIAGIDDLPKLDLSLIAERIEWVDVRLAAQKYRDEKYEQIAIGKNKPQAITASLHAEQGWFDGFKANQSLNEKKYTLADVENAFNSGRGYGNPDDIKNFNSFIQSLSKPKEYFVEVEMEDVGGYRQDSMSGCWISKWQPKITNNTITKIIKKL